MNKICLNIYKVSIGYTIIIIDNDDDNNLYYSSLNICFFHPLGYYLSFIFDFYLAWGWVLIKLIASSIEWIFSDSASGIVITNSSSRAMQTYNKDNQIKIKVRVMKGLLW